MDGTDFASPTGIKMNGYVGTVQYGGGQVVMFYNKPVHNPAKSLAAGSPIYDDVTYVRIHPPGERLNIVDCPATGDHRQRYPMQWGQFQQNKQQVPDGTPIDLLYPDNPSVGATLRACGVYTIEQCADLSSNAMDNIGMGAQRWKNDATSYVNSASKGVKQAQFRHEIETRDREIKALNHKIELLTETINQIQKQGSQIGLEALSTAIAGAMQRPQHMPAVGFDSQTAQINAIGAATRPVVKKKTVVEKPKRARAKVA